ncbi:MAG: 50S ribosomal protein L29 [Candidatus Dojkabacteria bacterium]|nr:50S ribosomal protein L29 [Candidatus Dojkabacteria bacterium]
MSKKNEENKNSTREDALLGNLQNFTLKELRVLYIKLKKDFVTGKIKNTSVFSRVKKEIARKLTSINQRSSR